MIVRGIDFGRVWCASGAMNVAGSGYSYHKLFGPLLSFKGVTLVAKTVTAYEKEGNMPLRDDGVTPEEFRPKCIIVHPFKGHALNAVGLSNKGLNFYLEHNVWKDRMKPLFLSFMPVEKESVKRMHEATQFGMRLKRAIDTGHFSTDIGLQLNASCPNVSKHQAADVMSEIYALLDILSKVSIPIVIKISVTTTVADARGIAEHPACDGICVSNTIPWGWQPQKSFAYQPKIDWKGLFGSDISPLEHLGGGGLSGKPLYPYVLKWLKDAAAQNFPVPINAGGGIMSPKDALRFCDAGASSVSLGTMVMCRPWQVRRTTRAVNKYFARRNSQ